MKAVAQASHKRSLADFKEALQNFKHELVEDPIIRAHLDTLYDNMLEQNLCRIIEPYSRVQVISFSLASVYSPIIESLFHFLLISLSPRFSYDSSELFNNVISRLNCCISLFSFQVSHVARIINLPQDTVEKKLSQMILDHKFSGILDQGEGVLIIFEDTETDKTYEAALETIQSMGKVVDSLYQKAKKLS